MLPNQIYYCVYCKCCKILQLRCQIGIKAALLRFLPVTKNDISAIAYFIVPKDTLPHP